MKREARMRGKIVKIYVFASRNNLFNLQNKHSGFRISNVFTVQHMARHSNAHQHERRVMVAIFVLVREEEKCVKG